LGQGISMIYGVGRGVINLTYWRRNLCGSWRGKHTLLPAHFPLPFAGKFPWRRQMFWQTKRKLWKLWIALGVTMDINHFYGSHRLRSTRLGLYLMARLSPMANDIFISFHNTASPTLEKVSKNL